MSRPMEFIEFENLVIDFQQHESSLLKAKANDYATTDRLANFRAVAEFLGIEPSVVCLTYMLKHVQAISLAVTEDRVRGNWDWETEEGSEGLMQRIADARNYLLLLAACLEAELT